MVFSSLVFLFAYLPLTLLIYYVTPPIGRNIFLFIVNLIFYGWGEPTLVLLMVFNIAFNYAGGYLVDKYREDPKKKKLFLILTVILDIGILAVFKYTGMLVDTVNLLPFLNIPDLQISLPIGISFYTFQTMSYVIDVYRDDAPVSKSFINFGTYVALFPQLIAGPIVRYRDVAYQLDHRKETLDRFTKGVKLFCIGLGKKVLIANQMGALTSAMFGHSDKNGVLGTWVGIAAYTFQIYFDFSGYSDMACGLGNMLGFEFLKNFNYPYISESITDFWRRWHISLSTWFKEYVYIPLGGNRKGVKRQIINLLIVCGTVARRVLQLHLLGTLLRRPADSREVRPQAVAGQAPCRPAPHLHALYRDDRLGTVLLHRRRSALHLPRRPVQLRQRRDESERVRADSQLPADARHCGRCEHAARREALRQGAR